jgi:2-furoyl-CoA dehydrogenase 2Fe-2S iron sulfur subunit
LVDGRAVRSCLLYAVQVEGCSIETIEGLNRDQPGLTDLQDAFHRHYALQCGFCTPGILMSATQFLSEYAQPTEREVRDMLSGHICRCTGYRGIVDAILDTARQRAGKRNHRD